MSRAPAGPRPRTSPALPSGSAAVSVMGRSVSSSVDNCLGRWRAGGRLSRIVVTASGQPRRCLDVPGAVPRSRPEGVRTALDADERPRVHRQSRRQPATGRAVRRHAAPRSRRAPLPTSASRRGPRQRNICRAGELRKRNDRAGRCRAVERVRPRSGGDRLVDVEHDRRLVAQHRAIRSRTRGSDVGTRTLPSPTGASTLGGRNPASGSSVGSPVSRSSVSNSVQVMVPVASS